MNTDDDNTDKNHRPFGYWITAVDRLLRAEFATVFEDEGIARRDWRMLNRIDDTFPGSARTDRPLGEHKLHRLLELGWVEHRNEGWALTEPGTLAKQRLGVAVDEIRARVAGAVSPEEYATMTASLEKIAREFGWAEGRRLPRSRRRHGGRHPGGHRRHGRHLGNREGFDHHEGFRTGDRFGHGADCAHGEGFGPGDRSPRGEGFGRHRFSRRGAPAHIHFHHHHG
ncbi:hypothetical protein ACU045_01955 [Microbacterium sp. MAHUQ-60]|uniref:hypothetical protein n=1 Tax=unclassified Microbacterium TaxID=2609290 RepID=UPI0036183285